MQLIEMNHLVSLSNNTGIFFSSMLTGKESDLGDEIIA